jgi:hypothetical protein
MATMDTIESALVAIRAGKFAIVVVRSGAHFQKSAAFLCRPGRAY